MTIGIVGCGNLGFSLLNGTKLIKFNIDKGYYDVL